MNYKVKFKKVEAKNVDFRLDDIAAGITILYSSNYVLFLHTMDLEPQAYPISCTPDPFTNDITSKINFTNSEKTSIFTEQFPSIDIKNIEEIEGQVIVDTDRYVIAFENGNTCEYNSVIYRYVLLKVKQRPSCFINEKFIITGTFEHPHIIDNKPLLFYEFNAFSVPCNYNLDDITHEKIELCQYFPFLVSGLYVIYLTPISK